jgi:hypothetical protein
MCAHGEVQRTYVYPPPLHASHPNPFAGMDHYYFGQGVYICGKTGTSRSPCSLTCTSLEWGGCCLQHGSCMRQPVCRASPIASRVSHMHGTMCMVGCRKYAKRTGEASPTGIPLALCSHTFLWTHTPYGPRHATCSGMDSIFHVQINVLRCAKCKPSRAPPPAPLPELVGKPLGSATCFLLL